MKGKDTSYIQMSPDPGNNRSLTLHKDQHSWTQRLRDSSYQSTRQPDYQLDQEERIDTVTVPVAISLIKDLVIPWRV